MINQLGHTVPVNPQRSLRPTNVTGQPVVQEQALPSDQFSFQGNPGQAMGTSPMGQVQTAAPMQQVTGPPALPEGLQQLTQQVSHELLQNEGRKSMQQMVGIVKSDPAIIPTFEALGNAADQLAGGAEADIYYHTTQNVVQIDSAQKAVSQRRASGSTKSYGELLSEELKVQAEGMALFPHMNEKLLAEVTEEAKGTKPSADMSEDRIGIELLKKKLPQETVQQALSTLSGQPLYQASEPAKGLTESSSQTLTALADTASGFYPLAVGAKSLFFQSAQGVGQHPSMELNQMGQRLGQGMFAQGGEVDRVSPKFGDFARQFVKNPSNPAEAFHGATNLSMLMMAMNAGSQRAAYTGENPSAAMWDSLKTVIAQQSLMAESGPYLQQASMNAVQNQTPAPPPQNEPAFHLTQSNMETPESQYNKHLVSMMSPDQVQRAYQRAAGHPLSALAQNTDLAKLRESLELPPMGEARIHQSLSSFTNNLTAVQQASVQASQQQQA